jgi:hypothetical protein
MVLATKIFSVRVDDLRKHAQLLLEACQRFSEDHRHDEVLNIAVRLRVLVGSGNGSGLLFDLANETKEELSVMTLNSYGILKITEIENGTGRIIQDVEKKAISTQMPGRLPIVFIEGADSLYRKQDLLGWIKDGFLLDWDVPDGKGGAKVARFTPQTLINRYAGQEAAHSDPTYGKFGAPVESVTMQYNVAGKQLVVPVVYEYLVQVGVVVGRAALDFAARHSSA